MLSLTGIGLTIDGNHILDDVGLEVDKGELLAVIGPNGAGKTSLINVISGAMLPSQGTVALNQTVITRWAPHRRARAGLGRTFQTSNLFLGRTVAENVRLAAVATHLTWRSALRRTGKTEAAREHLELVGLQDKAETEAGSLSHGDRRKLELAMVLAQRPSVILLDEPMAGVNTEDVDGLVELIRRVHTDGQTIVLVEHHMHVVLDLADRIAVMHHGRLLAVDTPAAVIADPVVQSAYVGEPL